jgi:uncharacterized protein YndB with AHSA1/START domain
MSTSAITIEATIKAPIEKVWNYWTTPQHIMQWNNASDDWHTPHAENDLRPGGSFLSTMAAKDGSFSFDFSGIYDTVSQHECIAYSLEDSRKVSIEFTSDGETTKVVETFEPESENPLEMQQAGWQAILNNFKKYVETN